MSEASFMCSGYYGKQNLGDEAILASFLHEIEKYGHRRSQVRVVTADEDDTRNRHGVTPVRRGSVMAVVKAILRSHHVVLFGGGWHFEKLRAVLYALFLVLSARLFGRSFSIVCIGVEPITNPLSRFLVRVILRASDWVSVRDETSAQEFLKACASAKVIVAADPVFSEIYSGPAQKHICQELRSRPVVAVSLLDARGAKKYAIIRKDYHNIVDGIIERLDAEVILVCTSPGEGDVEVARYILKSCKHADRVHVHECAKNLVDLIPVVASSDLMVGMRYHALAMAALVGVPFAAIVRSPKVESICSILGQPILAYVDSYDVNSILDNVCGAFAQRELLCRNLRETVPMTVRTYYSSMEDWMAALEKCSG